MPAASRNWLTLTASVGSVPAATLVILLPPLFKPAFVKETAPLPAPAGVKVIPLPSILVVLLPALNSALVKPVNVGLSSYVKEEPV